MGQRSYLLVDDNIEFVENLCEILLVADADVRTAPSGEEALALVETNRFDAIVTDMRMPGMSGAEFVHQARALDADVPFILLSAYATTVQLRDARRHGLLGVLSKGTQIPSLIELVSKARRGGIIVLVEDDVALVDSLTEALNARGLTVCTASTVEEIRGIAARPYVALVDQRVHGALARLRLATVHQSFPSVPTVVITAVPDAANDSVGLFTKPFDTGSLVAKMETMYSEVVAPGQ